ncbi:MAG TPA: hypothetical protein VNR18_14615 [Hyphomicrobiales bacterium]|nr:hypothetical protein [Hyphomicrobiales bacterium]
MEANDGTVDGATTVVLVQGTNASLVATGNLFTTAALQPLFAGDTLEALCLVVERCPLAVLLDESCTPLDPWQFSLLVKSHPRLRQVRIVVLCRQSDPVARARAAAVRVDALLQKPFASDEVLAALRHQPGCAA